MPWHSLIRHTSPVDWLTPAVLLEVKLPYNSVCSSVVGWLVGVSQNVQFHFHCSYRSTCKFMSEGGRSVAVHVTYVLALGPIITNYFARHLFMLRDVAVHVYHLLILSGQNLFYVHLTNPLLPTY